MFQDMQLWADIRRRVLVENVSKRPILRETGMHWRTLEKVLANPEPSGYRAKAPRGRPKLDRWSAQALRKHAPRAIIPADEPGAKRIDAVHFYGERW